MTDTLRTIMDKVGVPQDMVNHPKHYTTGGIETLKVIEAKMSKEAYQGYLQGNVLKYLLRCDYKGKKQEDILKAQFYLNELVRVTSATC